MSSVRLRCSARAIILDEEDRILLCRFEFVRAGRNVVVWSTPGGGIEPGESQLTALRRELMEEVGLELTADPPHVWHQEVVQAGGIDGYDGWMNDFFLVRTTAFTARGTMSDAELAAENVTGTRWWSLAEIAAYAGPDLFGPRELGTMLATLLRDGAPAAPVVLGL